MTWREAIRHVAANMRVRQANAKRYVEAKNGPADSIIRAEGAAWAWGVMADELESAANEPRPHEGAGYVRKLGGVK